MHDLLKIVVSIQLDPDFGDLIEPDPVTFSFDAPGWKFLFLSLLLISLFLAYKKWLQFQQNRYRREALKQLRILEDHKGQENVQMVNDVMRLLKYTALRVFSRKEVAALHGGEWLAFLDSTCDKSNFTDLEQFILGEVYKKPSSDLDENKLQALLKESKIWIKGHAGKF